MDDDIIRGRRALLNLYEDANNYISDSELNNILKPFQINKSFCYYCRNETDYTTEDKTKRFNFGSHCLTYDGKDVYCLKCGRRMFIPEIEKYNVDQMEKSLNEFYKID
jgi:hypothetical protein